MIILLLEKSCRIIEKARKYKTKRKNKKKSGRIVGSDSPVFKKDLCASTGGFRPFDLGIIKLFSILLRAGYCLQVS